MQADNGQSREWVSRRTGGLETFVLQVIVQLIVSRRTCGLETKI